MACIYSTYPSGKCQFYESEYGDVKNVTDTDYGFVGKGLCVVDEDEFPDINCSAYENINPNEDEDEAE